MTQDFSASPDFSAERLAQLEQDLRSAPVNVCKEALDMLRHCPSEKAVPLFVAIAQDGEFLRRRFAVMGLGNHQTEASFQALRMLAQEEADSNVLAEIANSLFEFGEPSLPLIQDIFDGHSNWLLRQSIISIVMESDRDDMLLDMVQKALDDEEQSVVETGILALGKLLKGSEATSALDLLEGLASNQYWRIRWRTATTLTLSEDARAKALLATLQKDEHHRVVAAALEGSVDV